MAKDVVRGPQPQEDFLNTPDASEYLQKLQAGRIKLPSEANALEQEMFQQLQELQKKLRALSVNSGDLEKEIAAAQARKKAIARDIDLVSGEMTGYAKMLLSAEGARRDAAETAAKADEKTKPVDEELEVAMKTKPVDEELEVAMKPKPVDLTKPELVKVDDDIETPTAVAN